MGVIVVNPYSLAGLSNAYSMSMDGVNEYAEVADNSAFSFGAAGATENPFSLSIWFKPNTTATIQSLICKADSGQYEYSLIYWNDTRLYFELFSGLSASNWIGRGTNTSALTNGAWNHIVATYDGSKTLAGIKIYNNGTRIDTINDTAGAYFAMSNGTGKLYFGTQYPGFYNSGKLVAPAVFSKALSGAEVTELYTLKMGDYRTLSFGGTCLSAWHFPNGTTDYPTGTDYINGRNLTLINMESGDINTDVPT